MVKKDKKAVNAKRKKAAAKKPVVSTAIINKPTKKSGDFKPVYANSNGRFSDKTLKFVKNNPLLSFIVAFFAIGLVLVAYN